MYVYCIYISDNVTAITGTRTDQWFGSLVRSSGKGGYVVVSLDDIYTFVCSHLSEFCLIIKPGSIIIIMYIKTILVNNKISCVLY